MVIPTVRQLLRSQCIHQSATTLRTLASELSNTDYFVRMAPINRWDYLALGSNEPDGLKGEKCKKEKRAVHGPKSSHMDHYVINVPGR